MPRFRLLRALLILACMGGVIYLLASLYLPSPRRLIFGVDKRTGEVRVVRSNVTFLPPHRFYRLSFEQKDGQVQRDGLVQIMSAEGVPVTLTYRLRFGVATEQLSDTSRLVSEGWSAWIRARVAEAMAAVTRQVPIDELLSPTSQFNAQREPLRRLVAAHLARSGLNVTAFHIARIEPDRDALLRYKRAQLRRAARGASGRVAVIGLDGADWDLLSELSIDGRIPNLRALIRGGTTATLQTIQPTVAPLAWTTAATGLPADRHGIYDFFASGSPIDAYARRAPAVWEIAEAFGRNSLVVNWWAAWPPSTETITVYDTPAQHLPGAIHPPELGPRVASVSVPMETVGYDQVRRFLNISAAEYQQAVQSRNAADPAMVMREVLAKTWTDHRVALDLYQQKTPVLTMIHYEGTDVVNHLGAPFHPPQRSGISASDYRKYWPLVANYYSEIDRLIGEWIQVLSDDTTVIVMSGYGFQWGSGRPRSAPQSGQALSDHRNPGVFITYGNHVAASGARRSVSIYDITPAILAILGLPPATEMTGSFPEGLFTGITPVSSVSVASYNEYFTGRPMATTLRPNPQKYRQTLQVLGHVLDTSPQTVRVAGEGSAPTPAIPPERRGAYAWWNNRGIELRREGKLAEAVDAFQKAIDLNPDDPTPYLNMAMTLFDRQHYTAADNVFLMAIQKGLPNPEQWFVDFAALYRESDMVTRAIALLNKGGELLPQSYLIAANLGSALAQADRLTEALPELERALGLRPTSSMALNNLGLYYAKREDYARALDYWNRSLSIDPRQPQIRVAAEAAQSRL
ncbi:MAG TPA: alkaline phosphatase family protein [Thermoanaerobaculia bacterium]|nr:alkaline phosphatase family protein [Thermoanaerobaculia bacterium]